MKVRFSLPGFVPLFPPYRTDFKAVGTLVGWIEPPRASAGPLVAVISAGEGLTFRAFHECEVVG